MPSQSAIVDKLFALSSRIIHGATLEQALLFIYGEFRSVVPYDRIGFAEIDIEKQTVTSRWAKSRRPEHLHVGYTAPLAGSSLALVLEHRKPRIMNDLLAYLKRHPHSKSTELITSEGVRSSMTCPLFLGDKPFGFLFFSSELVDTYNEFHVKILLAISNQLALLLMTSRVEPAPEPPVVKAPPVIEDRPKRSVRVPLAELQPGMIVDLPVTLDNGRLFIAAGVKLTGQVIARLNTLESQGYFAIGNVFVR